jgi:2-oxo-4-hydroxy-4-carboxy-5-ureidoimidazoline decarboxylase
MTLAELNAVPGVLAEAQFLRCCGSRRWVRVMVEGRPFATADVMAVVAERTWWALTAADWLEAFAAHPRIGEQATVPWSAQEQEGTASASEDTRARLARGNRDYEQRFGYTFLVCATGKSAEEILRILEQRLGNLPDDELQVAAGEQRKIMTLRLMKLVSE